MTSSLGMAVFLRHSAHALFRIRGGRAGRGEARFASGNSRAFPTGDPFVAGIALHDRRVDGRAIGLGRVTSETMPPCTKSGKVGCVTAARVGRGDRSGRAGEK